MHEREDESPLPKEVEDRIVIGAIFPILRKHASELLDKNRTVFVKFTKLNLKIGSTIVFYIPGEKLLVGEAKAGNIKKMDPVSVWRRYKNKLFLEKEEYDDYVKFSPVSREERKMKEITVFELKKVRTYEDVVRAFCPVTSSGRYLTKKMARQIRRTLPSRS